MANLPTTVQVAFDLTGVDPDIFTLDDPVKGVLDSAYELGGDSLQDVTSYVRAVSVSRGRSRELERYASGQASIVLDNRDRTFDPTHLGSPYIGQIVPRKAVSVVTGDTTVFTGNAQDWTFMFDVSGDATATLVAVDGFGILARQTLDNLAVGTATTGARVDDILDAVSWPTAMRDLTASGVSLMAGTADGNALAYMQQVEAVEAGALYMSRDGLVTLAARGTAYADTAYDSATSYDAAGTPYAYPPPSTTSPLVFTDEADDGSSTFVPYMTLGLELGTDLLYNTANVTYGTATITAEDTSSQDTYGYAVYSVDGSMLATAAAGTALAQYVVARYQQPVTRISDISVEIAALPTAVQAQVLALDLTDVIKVRFRPGGVGARVERLSVVEGVQHDIGPASHRVTFRLSGVPGS